MIGESTAGSNTPALIYQNAIQPSAESIPFLISIQCPVCAQEGGLQRIFRVVAVAQHPNRETRASVVIPVDQRGVGINIACQHALNVGGIVGHVHFYNPPPSAEGHIPE